MEKEEHFFIQLSFWKTLILCHNLDVIHIKNIYIYIYDSIVDSLLSIEGKLKDNLNSHFDLQVIGIREQLHRIQRENRVTLPVACYSLTSNEKKKNSVNFLKK